MCEALGELRQAVAKYAIGFDVNALSVADARTALAQATAIESSAATIKALAANRAARGGGDPRRRGARSAAHELARATGTSVSSARDVLDVGRRLEDQPSVADAARQGQLSMTQASLITDAAEADPSAGESLLHQAEHGSLAELREAAARVKAGAHPDPEARRVQIRSQRSLRAWTDTEGEWQLRARGNTEDGAQIMAALAPIADEFFHSARRKGRRERPEAYSFDALVTLATEASSAEPSRREAGGSKAPGTRRRRGAPVELLVRLDWDCFLAGQARDGDTCELVGYGPVPMSVVRDLLETGDPFVTAILTRGKEVVGVAHPGRRPNAYQQSALKWLYPCCAVQGCVDQINLETDHRIDWATTHFTAFDLLDKLCRFHHRLKTTEGWALVDGRGKRDFVPPEDPRHPRRKRRAA
jgi:Domain of unknown function (DUF222)